MPEQYSDEELLNDLRDLAEELSETPTSTEYNEIGKAPLSAIYSHFGSWNDALREAGLEVHLEQSLTKEQLIEDLQELNERVTHTPPRKRDMNDRGKHGAKTYQDKFGSWNQAVETAGFTPRPPERDVAERPDHCELCEKKATSLDFHHWRYGENKKGCYLCRQCHDAVHEGPGNIQNVNWLPNSIDQLVNRHIELNGDASVDEIIARYNLPDVEILVERALEEHRPTDIRQTEP